MGMKARHASLMPPLPILWERAGVRGTFGTIPPVSPLPTGGEDEGEGDFEYSRMIERMRKRKAYDGPLGCEKPRRAALFPGDLGHATPFASPLQPISSADPVLS